MLSKLGPSFGTGLTLLLAALSQQPRLGAVTLTPHSLVTYDGQSHPAELGQLCVPENHRKKSDRLIQGTPAVGAS